MKDAQIASLLASYWGKADPDASGAPDHHTVLAHSLDVAACAFVLQEKHPLLRRAFAAGAEPHLERTSITIAAFCALHDLGKLDTRFQRKAPSVANALRPRTVGSAPRRYDHGTEGFRQIEADDDASELANRWLGPSALLILRAVCGHHGALPSRDECDPSWTTLPTDVRREDVRARDAFLELVVTFFDSRGALLPWTAQIDGAFIQRLAGLCAVSDWLGSNVTFFPYVAGPLHDLDAYWARACERALRACEESGLLRATPAAVGFRELFPGYAPRDVQILTERLRLDGPALIVVEAEMGKGKTEAALSLAARLLALGQGDGLTVALPTMATSNAMFGRVAELVPRLFPAQDVELALAHGRASRHPGFRQLIERGLRAADAESPEASVACARWLLNKKRVLLAQVGVGTIDQALQAALVVRHQFVRMFGLSRNVVIIDEVHAYDAYMEVLLEHLLSWLGALRVPVVLLSATLPSERRAALARAWLGTGGNDESASASAMAGDDLSTAIEHPYPLVSVTAPGGSATCALDAPPPSRSVGLEYSSHAADDLAATTDVAARLVKAARAGARVVWIRNTVREAQQAFRVVAGLAGDVEHILFHARYRGVDRSGIEQRVLERFGKTAPSGGRVLIATQVVEQSLDLDFDELHTDLAPIDLLFQRAGRLHRHERARLAGFEAPHLVVHGPSGSNLAELRFGPSRFVYDAGTLWLAARALRTRTALDLPGDIRPLVEESYHPASRAALLPLGGAKLVAAERKRAEELEAKRTKARQCCIAPTTADPDGEGALDDDDDTVQAFTRDGMSATLLPLWWSAAGARSLDASDEAPCWTFDAARSDAWRLASELFDQTLSLSARGSVDAIVHAADAPGWEAIRARFARFAQDSGLGRRVVPVPMRRDGLSAERRFKGWIRVGGKRRRVLYTASLGLLMTTEKDEEQAR